jgi:hypothetical protein
MRMKKTSQEKRAGISLDDLPPGLADPARRALAAAGLTRLDQFAQVSEAELLKLHGMGPKAIGALRAALAQCGLTFARASESRSLSEAANPQIARRAPKDGG